MLKILDLSKDFARLGFSLVDVLWIEFSELVMFFGLLVVASFLYWLCSLDCWLFSLSNKSSTSVPFTLWDVACSGSKSQRVM